MAVVDYGSALRMFRDDGTLGPDLDGPLVTGPRVALEGVGVVLFTRVSSDPYDLNLGVKYSLPDLLNFTAGDDLLRRIEADYAVAARTQVANVIGARFAFRRVDRGLALSGSVTTIEGLASPLVASVTDAIKVLFPTVPA